MVDGMPSRVQAPSDSDESILPWVGRRGKARLVDQRDPGEESGEGEFSTGGEARPVSASPISGEGISGRQNGSGVDSSDLMISASGEHNS